MHRDTLDDIEITHDLLRLLHKELKRVRAENIELKAELHDLEYIASISSDDFDTLDAIEARSEALESLVLDMRTCIDHNCKGCPLHGANACDFDARMRSLGIRVTPEPTDEINDPDDLVDFDDPINHTAKGTPSYEEYPFEDDPDDESDEPIESDVERFSDI